MRRRVAFRLAGGERSSQRARLPEGAQQSFTGDRVDRSGGIAKHCEVAAYDLAKCAGSRYGSSGRGCRRGIGKPLRNLGEIGRASAYRASAMRRKQCDIDFVLADRRDVKLFAAAPVHLYGVAPWPASKRLPACVARTVTALFAEARRPSKGGTNTIGDDKKVRMNRQARRRKAASGQRPHARAPVQHDSHLCRACRHSAVQPRSAHAQSSAAAECAVRGGGSSWNEMPANSAPSLSSATPSSSRRTDSGIRPSPQALSMGGRCASYSATLQPRCRSASAAASPAGPPPNTATSILLIRTVHPMQVRRCRGVKRYVIGLSPASIIIYICKELLKKSGWTRTTARCRRSSWLCVRFGSSIAASAETGCTRGCSRVLSHGWLAHSGLISWRSPAEKRRCCVRRC